MNAKVLERSIASDIPLLDIQDDLLWHKDGSLTLMYAFEPLHEPSMTDEDFDAAALAAENVWSSLPENTSYQFIVLVDERRGLEHLQAAVPPIPATSATNRLLEEFRQARYDELLRVRAETDALTIQQRRHYFAATFRPAILRTSLTRETLLRLRELVRGVPGLNKVVPEDARYAPGRGGRFETAYDRIMNEAAWFHRRLQSALDQQDLRARRCTTGELVSLMHELLNPTASDYLQLDNISQRSRTEQDGFPRSIVDEYPFLGDVPPAWSLLDDDMVVHHRHLQVGDRYVTVLNLKELPDTTEPGVLVPLMHLPREKYRLVYRIDVPDTRPEFDALRAKAALAEGLRLENLLVQSNRPDPHAEAVGKQSQEAMRKLIASAQRIFGVSLQLALYERSPEELEEAVQETLSQMARAHGLHGQRETFLLKPAYLSMLPGAPPLLERRRKALTPVAVDLMPVFDSVPGEGKVPFVTPSHSIVLYDPFDTRAQANANALITGIPGAGKSVLAQMVLSGYEIAGAGRGEPPPHVFILDNGASYERYMRLREEDGRYVRFTFSSPPGVDVFDWSEDQCDRDEHISRLEWLLLDLLRVDESQEERFERKKAAVEEALNVLYGGDELPHDMRGFAKALARTAEGAELANGLFPFTEGKFARLFEPNPALALSEDVRAVCYDFMGLAEHPDYAAIALRLVIFQVRRFAARMNERRRRTFLMLDESWSLLDARVGRSGVTHQAASFLTSSVRMGRKEGCAIVALSQNIADFAGSALGSAIVENSSTKFVGLTDAAGIEPLRKHLQLTSRQVQQVRSLARTDRYHEFLFVQGERSSIIRVPLDPLSRWVFTTSPKDRDRIAALAANRPDLTLLDQMRLLARQGA
jgi:hypothetical protein